MNEEQVFSLFGGDIELAFEPGRHYYRVRSRPDSGVVLPAFPDAPPGSWFYTPSVTTVTHLLDKSNALIPWAVRLSLDYLEEHLGPDIVVPAVERALDQIEAAVVNNPTIQQREAVTLEEFAAILNNLVVGMDEIAWKGARDMAATERKRVLDQAGDIGNLAHGWIENFVKFRMGLGPEPPLPINEVVNRAMKKWLKWEHAHVSEWLASEQKVYSPRYNYSGTYDALAIINGVLTLVDFKTSKRLYIEHRLQTAAYQQAVSEEFEDPIGQRLILIIKKDTGYTKAEFLTEEQYPWKKDLAGFLGLRQAYWALKGA